MDSGRLALLEKAREFGSLAQNSSWEDFLEKSVTYRTLAQLLGIQKEWWEEFWRSFYFTKKNILSKKVQEFHFCCKAADLPLLMRFLCSWFGINARIADISEKEFWHVYHLVMRK